MALDATLTTAWAYVTPPSGQKIIYYAQPEASTFYRTQLQQGETPGFLRLMEVQAAALSATPARAVAFPLLPYARLEGALTQDFFQFEVQVVSPTRRGMIPNLEAASGEAGMPRVPALAAGERVGIEHIVVAARSLVDDDDVPVTGGAGTPLDRERLL